MPCRGNDGGNIHRGRRFTSRGIPRLRRDNLGERGFTLIEVIAVLIIAGIVSAVAISRGVSASSFSLSSETQILKTNLRYAQAKALSDNTSWGLTLTSGSYTLQNNGANSSNVLPGESLATHAMPAGVTCAGAATVTFDHWGSPGTTTQTITLSGGGDTNTITITRETGFIP